MTVDFLHVQQLRCAVPNHIRAYTPLQHVRQITLVLLTHAPQARVMTVAETATLAQRTAQSRVLQLIHAACLILERL